MDELLNDEQKQLRDSAMRLCAEKGGAKRARTLRDQGQELDRDALDAMQEAGWLATMVPEERGGLGLSAVELYLLLEPMGRHAVMAPLLESAATAWALGRSETAGTALASILEEGRLIVPALQADGWNFRNATPGFIGRVQDGVLIVKGTVPFVPFAASADGFLIDVATSGEAMLCLVERNDPGCAVSMACNVDGSASGSVTLTNMTIAPASVVARGDEAIERAASLADLMALGTAVQLLGICESAMAMTLEHVRTRKQFGHALGSFQALQHRLVDNYVDVEVNRALLHRICSAWDDDGAAPAMIAGVKARSARVATEMLRTGLQLHGAIGYTDEHDIGILWKHALVLGARYGNELTQSDRFARLTMEEA
jgi:alkylation response protein AidB-like acyl-CoA dehydrogenase